MSGKHMKKFMKRQEREKALFSSPGTWALKRCGDLNQASLSLLQSRVLDIRYSTPLTPGFFRREGQTDSSIPHHIFQNEEMKLCSQNTPCSRDPHHFLVWIKGQHVYLRAYWKLMDCLSPTNHKGIYSPWKELWNHSQEWWAPQHRSIIWKSLASISIAPFGDKPLNSLWGSEKLSCSEALPWGVGNLTPQCWMSWFICCNNFIATTQGDWRWDLCRKAKKALSFYTLLLKSLSK